MLPTLLKNVLSLGLWYCGLVSVTNNTEERAVFGVMTLCGLVRVTIITEDCAVIIFTTELLFMMKHFIIIQC